MKTKLLALFCFVACSATLAQAQVKPKAPPKPITTQTATTGDGRSVILKSDGTWAYETSGPSASIFTLTGKCRFQLIQGFLPCSPRVIFGQTPNGVSHLTFIKNENGKQMLFTLFGRSDRQPNLENYYVQIDTFSIDGVGDNGASDNNMEGECHFRMNKSGKNFFFVKCDIYNRAKGTMYNFYLESITKTHRDVIN